MAARRGTHTDQPAGDGAERDERDEAVEEDIDEIEEEVDERNPDPTTKREVFEREAAERGRSDDAGEVGDVIDGEDDRDEEDRDEDDRGRDDRGPDDPAGG